MRHKYFALVSLAAATSLVLVGAAMQAAPIVAAPISMELFGAPRVLCDFKCVTCAGGGLRHSDFITNVDPDAYNKQGSYHSPEGDTCQHEGTCLGHTNCQPEEEEDFDLDEYADVLLAMEAGDEGSMRRFLATRDWVSYSVERKAIQIADCTGRIIANIPVQISGLAFLDG